MYFATHFDKNYISRAEVMLQSLSYNLQEGLSKVFILCLDDDVLNFFWGRSQIELITLEDIELFFPELLKAKKNRTYVEYIFTLSPFLPLYILKKFPYIKRITSLDADLYFMDSPHNILNNLGEKMIGITKHDFPEDLYNLNVYGKFNVSFQSFPNTINSIDCLENWSNNCLEYCGDKLDELGRFADQKYLDDWIFQFDDIYVFKTPVIGLAPWNLKKFKLEIRNNRVFSNNQVVIFYHFHGFRVVNSFYSTTEFYQYNIKIVDKEVKFIYNQYWELLSSVGLNNDLTFMRNGEKDLNWAYRFFRDLLKKSIIIKIFKFKFYFN